MAITIAMLRAAGASDEVIVKVLELDQADELEREAERREANRIAAREYRARKKVESYQQARHKRHSDADDANGKDQQDQRPRHTDETGTLFAQESPTTESESKRVTTPRKGTRLPPDWTLPEPQHTWALQQGLSNEEIAGLVEDFRDYWIAVPGQKGIKLDWSATFRQRVRWFLNSPRRMARASRPKGSYATHWKAQHTSLEESLRRGWG